ncbi:sodium/glutamate symporter [Mobilicoccus caccae]|uniref:Sodium:glutamate symporter n=1 Tax=Mobilicoccus caccae TaxID=1859295 RepID=A0ABQ6INV5_9MICO|nr:sodium:glutamate symporter [Mobilicoccus caccae]GMA39015.1 sodium:glutamate symporter [Mobilicoccus caccae]
MSADSIGFALLLLGIILLVGKGIRITTPLVQRLFLPSSIIAGFLALFLGPEVLGALANAMGSDRFSEAGLFTPEILDVWSALPGLLISIVFATLFLGADLPSPRRVTRLVGPQLSIGVIFASGQYVVGLLLAVAILVPFFGSNPMTGALIEMGFEGGHGTAAGMRESMESLGFAEGGDLALGIATVGVVGGVILGVAFINWAVRTGRTECLDGTVEQSLSEQRGLFRDDENFPAATMTTRPASIEPLSLHFAFIAAAVIIGVVLLEALQAAEQWGVANVPGYDVEILSHVPLFPLAMLGGVIIQVLLQRTGHTGILDHQMMLRIQGFALDVLIVSALATLSLTAIAANWQPFVILCVAGIVFNVFVLLVLCPRIIGRFWFERGIGDFGQSMGVTATGLILMRIADPENESPAYEAFGYKQLVFEPFFGGGFVTAAAIPLIYAFGPVPLLVAMTIVLLVALGVGLFFYGPRGRREIREARATADVS